MIRREVFAELGGFDESLPACEDYDLWLRLTATRPVFLIDRPLIVKTGGHADQLSRMPGLDRYRAAALRKILDSGTLKPAQEQAARAVLAEKARVYAEGCRKRGRDAEAEEYFQLAREEERADAH